MILKTRVSLSGISIICNNLLGPKRCDIDVMEDLKVQGGSILNNQTFSPNGVKALDDFFSTNLKAHLLMLCDDFKDDCN